MARGRPRTWPLLCATAAGLGLAACGGGSGGTSSGTALRPDDPLGQLRAQAGRLLDGGPALFQADLVALRGHPVVVNQWASWCDPCRFEFPLFRREAGAYGGRVAFLGDNAQDSREDARRFLRSEPVPYPHFYDLHGDIARVFKGGRAFPTTAFYDRAGRLTYTHPGSYPTQAKLDADIRRYAIHG